MRTGPPDAEGHEVSEPGGLHQVDQFSNTRRVAVPPERLDSWKEVACLLGRSVRTVQRWERMEELPIHRLVHNRRATVFAYAAEIREWESRRDPRQAGTVAAFPKPCPQPLHALRAARRTRVPYALVLLAFVLACGTAWLVRHHRRSPAPPEPRTPIRSTYRNR